MSISKPLKHTAQALLLAGALLALYVWHFGLQWPPQFELAWDEEVQLHDGRIINVHIKRSYERRHLLSSWDAVHRATEISFDAGPPLGRFTTRIQPHDVALIDQKDQIWYFGLVRATGAPPLKPVGGQVPFLMLQPDGLVEEAAPGATLPAEFIKWNVMPDTPNPEGVAKFNHTDVRLAEKMRHWAAHPRANGDDVMRLRPKN